MQNEIHVIIGRKGSGKTTHALKLAYYADFANILWYDTISEFAQTKIQKLLPGFEKIRGINRLESKLVGILMRAEKFLKGTSSGFLIVYEPSEGRSLADLGLTYELLKARFKITKQAATIIVDEADLFNRGNNPAPVIRNMVQQGRHIELDQIYITQRPKGLTNDVMAQADHWWIFHTNLPADLERLSQHLPPRVVEEIGKLKVGQSIHFDVAKNKAELVDDDET